MTLMLIDGVPHADFIGLGLRPVRPRRGSPRAAADLSMAVTAAILTGESRLTVPGLEVEPIPDSPSRRFGFQQG